MARRENEIIERLDRIIGLLERRPARRRRADGEWWRWAGPSETKIVDSGQWSVDSDEGMGDGIQDTTAVHQDD